MSCDEQTVRVTEKIAAPPEHKSILALLFGRPLSSEEDVKERIGPSAGIPVFGLDALSSAGYENDASIRMRRTRVSVLNCLRRLLPLLPHF